MSPPASITPKQKKNNLYIFIYFKKYSPLMYMIPRTDLHPLSSGDVLLPLVGPHSLPMAAPHHTRPSFMKQLGRMLFGLCSLQKSHENTPCSLVIFGGSADHMRTQPSHMTSRGSRGCIRGHSILLQSPHS